MKKIIRVMNCIYRIFDKKAVIYLVKGKRVIQLNETATRLWFFLSKKRTIEEVSLFLVKAYEVRIDKARKDIDRFVVDGLKHGFLNEG